MNQLKKTVWRGLLLLMIPIMGNAAPLTVREIYTSSPGVAEIELDRTIEKGLVRLEYVRDIVQITLSNATIYPAKMLHTDEQPYSKVFAYQYSPEVVRVRFTVGGEAQKLEGKIKFDQKGNRIKISFPEASSALTEKEERSLIAKITDSMPKMTVEEVTPAKAKANERERDQEKQVQEKGDAKNLKNQLTGKKESKNEKLGAKEEPASPMRGLLITFAFMAVALGLALWFKRGAKGQAKRSGGSFLSRIFTKSNSGRPMIEVLGSHPLGPKQSIVMVRIKDQELVLGVTEGNVQLITQVSNDSDEIADVNDVVSNDPDVQKSLGMMFGVVKPSQKTSFHQMANQAYQNQGQVLSQQVSARTDTSFTNSNALSASLSAPVATRAESPRVRDQIRRRLEGQISP